MRCDENGRIKFLVAREKCATYYPYSFWDIFTLKVFTNIRLIEPDRLELAACQERSLVSVVRGVSAEGSSAELMHAHGVDFAILIPNHQQHLLNGEKVIFTVSVRHSIGCIRIRVAEDVRHAVGAAQDFGIMVCGAFLENRNTIKCKCEITSPLLHETDHTSNT